MKLHDLVAATCFDLQLVTNQKVKLVKYGAFQIVIVTIYNKVFYYENYTKSTIEVTNFKEIDYINFGNIKFLECSKGFTIIVNDLNEFFLKGKIADYISENKFSKLNLQFNENIENLSCGWTHLIILTKNHSLYGLGSNYNGQLGLTDEVSRCRTLTQLLLKIKVKEVKCGSFHSAILDFNGNIYTTGANNYGQLGLGSSEEMFEFTKVELPFKVIKIFSDNFSLFLLSENNELYATGYSEEGQLGVGCRNIVNEFTKVILDKCYNDIEVYTSFNKFSFLKNNNLIYSADCNEDERYDCISVFTKIIFKENSFNYIYPLFLESFRCVITSDYEINSEKRENGFIVKLFQKVHNCNLVDTSFIF